MSINELRAIAYSQKCANRRIRVEKRRERRLNRLQEVCIPFSVGFLMMAVVLAIVI